jgi:hypothetical protein
MNKSDFIARFFEALDVEPSTSSSAPLSALDEWDSLGILSIISLYDELEIAVELAVISELQTADDAFLLYQKKVKSLS